MRNKMLAIVGVLLVLFIALYFVFDYKNKKAIESEENPYGEKEDLEQATIDEIGDELYDNQINPDDLRKKVDSGDPVTVYFYSPDCVHCQRTTPVLVPLTRERDIDMKKLNLLEYKPQWDEYAIEGTPTVVYFEDGKEVARITGEQSEEGFNVFFDEYILKE